MRDAGLEPHTVNGNLDRDTAQFTIVDEAASQPTGAVSARRFISATLP